jgi:HK97 gp10 family phage protein
MRVKLQLTGFKELLADLERVAQAGEEAAAWAVEKIANGTAERARERIGSGAGAAPPGAYPKSKTGRLERSIGVLLTQAKTTTAIVGTAQLHGRFLELGTSRMEPRPWLLPSFEDARDDELAGLRAEFESRI